MAEKNKQKIITRIKVLDIINGRIEEIFDELKRAFTENLETLHNYEEKFEIIKELEVLKIRIYNYKK